MKDSTRRNRNIGTSKQGHGKNNRLVIPFPALEMKIFYERLGEYCVVEEIINEHKFKFVVEQTRETCSHACTIEDIKRVIRGIPRSDYGNLELIILRQPSRKEDILKPAWGRLVYSYEFEGRDSAAILIEAVDLEKPFKWTKKLSVEAQKELDRLREDGHKIESGKRYYTANYELDNIRATQLYRTLLHEFGHYVHYLEVVERPATSTESFSTWEKRADFYHNIPTAEKEVYANRYATEMRERLEKKGIIPFERILTKDYLNQNNLRREIFLYQQSQNA